MGRHFYAGLGRKTERLESAGGVPPTRSILRLEQQYSHADIQAALEIAIQHDAFDPAAVHYLLRTGRLVAADPSITPTPIQVEMEERALDTYDQLWEASHE